MGDDVAILHLSMLEKLPVHRHQDGSCRGLVDQNMNIS